MSHGTATSPIKPNTPSNLGDETLIGTQLEVISQLQDGTVSPKFQITSAIGLDATQFDDLRGHFENARLKQAIKLLKDASVGDQRFNGVLDAVTPGLLGPAPKGKDGFPNLRCMIDFGAKPVTRTFQIHTILDFKPTGDPEQLKAALPRKNFQEIERLVKDHCTIRPDTPVSAMLSASLS